MITESPVDRQSALYSKGLENIILYGRDLLIDNDETIIKYVHDNIGTLEDCFINLEDKYIDNNC